MDGEGSAVIADVTEPLHWITFGQRAEEVVA